MNIRVTVVETTCTQPLVERGKSVAQMFVLWNWPWTKSATSQSGILLAKWIRFLSIGRSNQRKFEQLSEYKNLSDKHLKLIVFAKLLFRQITVFATLNMPTTLRDFLSFYTIFRFRFSIFKVAKSDRMFELSNVSEPWAPLLVYFRTDLSHFWSGWCTNDVQGFTWERKWLVVTNSVIGGEFGSYFAPFRPL